MTTNVSKLIKDNNVEYVDLRFADMRGLQHHVTFPARTVDETFFEEGKMFEARRLRAGRESTTRTWC